jgi:hypothetical protein
MVKSGCWEEWQEEVVELGEVWVGSGRDQGDWAGWPFLGQWAGVVGILSMRSRQATGHEENQVFSVEGYSLFSYLNGTAHTRGGA